MEDLMFGILGFVLSWKMVALIVLVYLACSCIYTVSGKTAAILETFGKPCENATMPGLCFKAPWPIQTIVARVTLQQQDKRSDVSVKTKDNAFMTLPVTVQYRASDEPSGAVKAHYELEDPERQISSYILNNVRQTASGMEMAELYANRDSMEQQVQDALSERFAQYGYVIVNVLVDEPQPSEEVKAAFNQVIASKRKMEAAANEAEAARIKLVGAAKAEAESKELQGQGMAKMREAIAKGLEGSMKIMTAAGLSVEKATEFLAETNRQDTITTAAAHGNLIIVDVKQSSGIVDTIAGVKAVKES